MPNGPEIHTDEAVARAEMTRLEGEFFRVLSARRAAYEAAGSSSFGRYLELAAVAEVLGELMTQAIVADPAPERVSRFCAQTLDRLRLYVAPPSSRAQ